MPFERENKFAIKFPGKIDQKKKKTFLEFTIVN